MMMWVDQGLDCLRFFVLSASFCLPRCLPEDTEIEWDNLQRQQISLISATLPLDAALPNRVYQKNAT